MNYELSKINEYACIIIGDEILETRVRECNYFHLAQTLLTKGYSLKEVRIVSDSVQHIANTITELRKKYTFVVSTGGIGVTHDDRTMEAYAKSFDTKLVMHQEMKDYFVSYPHDTEEKKRSIEKMSMMPAEVELIYLDERWPLLKLQNCYIMPGIPSICKITTEKLQNILPEQPKKIYAEYFVDSSEHEFFEKLQELADRYSNSIIIGSYPLDTDCEKRSQGYRSKISLTSVDKVNFVSCEKEMIAYIQSRNWKLDYTAQV